MDNIDDTVLERFSPFYFGKFSKVEFLEQFGKLKIDSGDLLEDDVIAYLVLVKNGRIPRSISALGEMIEGSDATVSATVISIDPKREFERKDGAPGTVMTLNVEDPTGKCRVVLWDTKLQALVDNCEIKAGTELLIINSRYKKGLYGPELTPGKNSHVKILNPDEKQYWDRLMAKKYGLPATDDKNSYLSLIDLYGDMEYQRVDVRATVRTVGDVREFKRKDGSSGHVVNIRIYDGTAEAILTLWDKMALESGSIRIGDNIHIENGRPKTRDGMVEIHSGYSTKLTIV